MGEASGVIVHIFLTSCLFAFMSSVETVFRNGIIVPGTWQIDTLRLQIPLHRKYPVAVPNAQAPYFTQGQLEYIKSLLVGLNDSEINKLHGNFLEQMPQDNEGNSAAVQQTGFACAGYRPYPGNPSYYLEFDGFNWYLRFCQRGYAFDVNTCYCSVRLETSTPAAVATTTQGVLTTTTLTPDTTTALTTTAATSASTTTTTVTPSTTSTTTEKTTTLPPSTATTTDRTTTLAPTTATTERTTTLAPTTTTTTERTTTLAPTTTTTTERTTTLPPTTTTTTTETTRLPPTIMTSPTTTQPTTTQFCAGYRPYLLDIHYYLQYDGAKWVKKSCPSGFGFDYITCSCSIWLGTTSASSTTMSTTTRPGPTTDNPYHKICSETVVLQGAGFAPLPGTCDAYILCRFYGDIPISMTVKRCPIGLHWNQDKLTCDYAINVGCISGRNCQNRRPIPGDKRGFLQLTESSWVHMPCPSGFGYNEQTCGCTEKLYEHCQDKRPAPGNPRGFLYFNGMTWIFRPCPPALMYNPYSCLCTIRARESDESDDSDEDDDDDEGRYSFGRADNGMCRPSLKLIFSDDDVKDMSQNRFLVSNENVSIKNGKAYFNGRSRLVIPQLSNWEFGSTVYIFMKYKHTSANSQQTLLANGDRQVPQSIAICSGKNSVNFYAETKGPPSAAKIIVPATNGVWRSVIYELNKGYLHGYVGKEHSSQPVKVFVTAPLLKRQKSLIIGGGGSCDNFHGLIDEIQVFFCKPDL